MRLFRGVLRLSPARFVGRWCVRDGPKKLGRPLALLAAVGVACGGLSGFSTSATANDVEGRSDPIAQLRSYVERVATAQPVTTAIETANQRSENIVGSQTDGDTYGLGASPTVDDVGGHDPIVALRNYVQRVGVGRPRITTAEDTNRTPLSVPGDAFDDHAYAALRAFTQRIPASSQQPSKAQPKLADADNAFDALKEFFQKQNGTAPPEKPKAAAPPPPRPQAPAVAATYVGTKVCLGCHSSQAGTFGYTLMGRLLKQGKLQCETCHGAGSAHVKAGGGRGVGGIISFRQDDTSRTAEENNSVCLSCHERGERTNWQGSVHEERGLSCTNCHTIMKAVSAVHQLKTAFEPDTCFQCHKDRRAQMFRSSHMPMREGKVVCSDCHNPHGSVTEALLRTDSVNDTCYKCHAEKRGPFLFEHAPVRENCLNCHDPHGSINEFSLKMSRPRLCYECHTIGHTQAGPNSQFTMSQACQNCHTQIHGSNSPAGAVFQR